MIERIRNFVPPFFRSFYFLSGLFFVIWVGFIDSNDVFLQLKLAKQEKELVKEKEFYEDKILEVKNDREALLSNPKLLEKLAREKYLMKKDNEDLYIVIAKE